MSTLNKQETKTIYFDLLNKAREQYEITSFGQRAVAYAWCKNQPEFAQLSNEEQMHMFNQL
jgi:hypothetical protein